MVQFSHYELVKGCGMKFLERLRGVTYEGQIRFIAVLKITKAAGSVKYSICVIDGLCPASPATCVHPGRG